MTQDFPPIFHHNMLLPWQHIFCHCQKKNICAKFHENWWKTEEVVSDARFFPHFCHYHGNRLSATVKKNVSCTSTPQGKHLCQIHENCWKTEEVVRDARFSPHFCHNMPLPWQLTFCHCQKKMCLAHLHPKANICAEFHENWWKTEEVVRDTISPPPTFLP